MIDEVKANASSLHRATFECLRELYPLARIHQEYKIKVDNHTLFIDIFMEKPLRIAFECHGEQHFKFVSHFHDSAVDFRKQVRLDMAKANWCEKNKIPLIVVTYKDKITTELLSKKIDEVFL